MRTVVAVVLPLALYACHTESAAPPRTPHGVHAPAVTRSLALSTSTLDTTGLRCVLHSTKGAASVDSCAAVTTPIVAPPPPPAPPPAPAPAPPPPPPAATIATADSFTKSVGVNTHFHYFDLAPYAQGTNVTRTVSQIKALGVAFIRDGTPYIADVAWNNIAYAPQKSLVSQGVKVVFIMQPAISGNYTSTNAIDTAVARLGAQAFMAFEGPNEVDLNAGQWGGSPAYGANTKTFQCAAYARARALVPGVRVISPSVVSTGGASNMPDLSACADGGTMHPYPGGLVPMAHVAAAEAYTGMFVKGKPFWITEAGYHSNVNGTINHYQPGVSEAAQAKYITREYLDYFKAGIPHSATYEFIDEHANLADDEANFGLVHNDGSPKPAYTALLNLLAAVRDTGAPFVPAPFAYTLNGATNSVRVLGLAKRSGVVDVLLWNDVSVYDLTAKADLTNAPVAVTVTLTTTPSKITAEYPVSGSALTPIASAKSFTVSVTDSPVIVEITP